MKAHPWSSATLQVTSICSWDLMGSWELSTPSSVPNFTLEGVCRSAVRNTSGTGKWLKKLGLVALSVSWQVLGELWTGSMVLAMEWLYPRLGLWYCWIQSTVIQTKYSRYLDTKKPWRWLKKLHDFTWSPTHAFGGKSAPLRHSVSWAENPHYCKIISATSLKKLQHRLGRAHII